MLLATVVVLNRSGYMVFHLFLLKILFFLRKALELLQTLVVFYAFSEFVEEALLLDCFAGLTDRLRIQFLLQAIVYSEHVSLEVDAFL